MCLFNYNTRETDIFGQIGDGTIIMSLTHTDKQGVEHVVRRVYDHVKNRVFMLYKEEVTVSISMGVSFFSERLKDPEDLTLAAIAAVNRAITNGESEWVVYHELSD
jgi:GGDEF domain-containing protein